LREACYLRNRQLTEEGRAAAYSYILTEEGRAAAYSYRLTEEGRAAAYSYILLDIVQVSFCLVSIYFNGFSRTQVYLRSRDTQNRMTAA
jgi:hypothetical protein